MGYEKKRTWTEFFAWVLTVLLVAGLGFWVWAWTEPEFIMQHPWWSVMALLEPFACMGLIKLLGEEV